MVSPVFSENRRSQMWCRWGAFHHCSANPFHSSLAKPPHFLGSIKLNAHSYPIPNFRKGLDAQIMLPVWIHMCNSSLMFKSHQLYLNHFINHFTILNSPRFFHVLTHFNPIFHGFWWIPQLVAGFFPVCPRYHPWDPVRAEQVLQPRAQGEQALGKVLAGTVSMDWFSRENLNRKPWLFPINYGVYQLIFIVIVIISTNMNIEPISL